MNFGTSQFLHSPPLSQAGRLDGLEDGSGSAAPQSRVDGRQCPLVEQQQQQQNRPYLSCSSRAVCVCVVDDSNFYLQTAPCSGQYETCTCRKKQNKKKIRTKTVFQKNNNTQTRACMQSTIFQQMPACLTLTMSASCLVRALSDSWSLSTIQGWRRT